MWSPGSEPRRLAGEGITNDPAPGLQWYWKGDFVKTLPDEAIDAHITHCLMHLYPIDGAVRRVGKDATPWSARDAAWSMVIAGISPDPKDAEALKRWGRAYRDIRAMVR